MINFLLDTVSEKLELDVRYFTKGSFYLTLNQVFGIIIGTLLSIIYANHLSSTTFGQYNFVLSFVSLFSILYIQVLMLLLVGRLPKEKKK